MDSTLRALAIGQRGVFTTSQAGPCGVDERELRRLVKAGETVHLGRGAYALTEAWPSEVGPQGEVARHLVRCRAALQLYPDARLCGVSLLVAEGVAIWGVPLRRVELARDVRQEVLTQSYRIRPVDPLTRPPGTDRRAIAAALVQLCLDHGVMPMVCAADNAMHELKTSYVAIEDVARRVKGRARSSRLATTLPLLDARSESVGESRLRVTLTLMGHKVLVQVPITDGGEVFARADLGIDGTNLLIEFDGKVKYAGDAGGEAVWAEKKREDRIRGKKFELERFIWVDLARQRVIDARTRAALQRSEPRPTAYEENQRGRTVSPKDTGQLGRAVGDS